MKDQGFGSMSLQKRRALAQKGGLTAHRQGKAYKYTPEEAKVAGKKGAAALRAKLGENGYRAHMAKIGRAGGDAVSSDRGHMAEIGRIGGEGKGPRAEDKESVVEEVVNG